MTYKTKMKLNLMYGTGVIVLPAAVYPGNMPPDASYLHVLLAICAEPTVLSDAERAVSELEAKCHLPAALITNAIAYWMDCGVLAPAAEASEGCACTKAAEIPPAAPPEQLPKKTPRPALPAYSSAECARILRETDGLRAAIDECARIAGKLFSEHETGQLAALCDSYGLGGAYLMTLFMYCRSHLGKTAVNYVVRTALGLYDDGVRTLEALEAHISARERARDNEYKLRRLLGLGERALTAREREYVEAWTEWAMPIEVITRAYEITVQNIGAPRMSYINKILSGWNDNGIRTLAAVEAAEAEFEQKKTASRAPRKAPVEQQPASYDLDAFVDAAIERSLAEEK